MMNRRNFLLTAGAAGTAFTVDNPLHANPQMPPGNHELKTDVLVAGGGLGGVAATLALCRNGLRVIMTEETDWIGGQVAQQGVPPDEHQWIESHGAPASYREYRNRVRGYYQRNYPMTDEAAKRPNLNPGDGSVSRICHEPRVTVAVLYEMLQPYLSSGQLRILLNYRPSKGETSGDKVSAVEVAHRFTGQKIAVRAPYFVDATETGELLPLTKTEYVKGTESKSETRELHAPEKADPDNHQAFTLCFALGYEEGADHVIDKPAKYSYWSKYIPPLQPAWSGKQLELKYSNPKTLEPKELGFNPRGEKTGNSLNLWLYRRILNKANFRPGTIGDVSLVNWPQNDYMMGNLIDVSEKEVKTTLEGAKQLNLSFLYWLQTEAPRPDGGLGWKGLRLRHDIMGTEDGMAMYPYIRESRRIRAEFTILEEHVGAENRKLVAGDVAGKKSADFFDSVGTGYYHIDLHPSNKGNNYIDFASLPFQIPLGALLPRRVDNLLPANKNIGTTHITNGCYRLHPVEWSIGEATGMLIVHAMQKKIPPRAIRADKRLLGEFQEAIRKQGLETHWPE
ncbi:FAD-dependent oxidoreductase [Ravibacter arvi]|uniref:FAD-dependent oxidoreductase n=1 Tax=Ravibacter arvi TaxID=2051041 RepID=A0ABP8M0S5_9BACT